MTEGARRDRHENKETTRTATENSLSRSTDFLVWKLNSNYSYPIKLCLLMSCHFTLSSQRGPIHSGNVILFRHTVCKSKTCVYNRGQCIVMSETPRKKLSGRGRPAKQPSCNDLWRVCSVNFKTYYRQFNQNCVSTENLFEEPKRAGVEKCPLVDLLQELGFTCERG